MSNVINFHKTKLRLQGDVFPVRCPVVKTTEEAQEYLHRGAGVGIDLSGGYRRNAELSPEARATRVVARARARAGTSGLHGRRGGKSTALYWTLPMDRLVDATQQVDKRQAALAIMVFHQRVNSSSVNWDDLNVRQQARWMNLVKGTEHVD